jgi:dTDP-4-dehydrorhamnose 3,5-epimerase
MIQGVVTTQLKMVPDERGWLMEILRCDDEAFKKFGQAYLTTAYPQVTKAWHFHKKQTDNMTCIKGMMKVVLFDSRGDSPTYREINEFFIGERNTLLITIPPYVYHGFKALGDETAYMLNIPDLPYDHQNPDEHRLPPDSKEIPYDWLLTPGKKHG